MVLVLVNMAIFTKFEKYLYACMQIIAFDLVHMNLAVLFYVSHFSFILISKNFKTIFYTTIFPSDALMDLEDSSVMMLSPVWLVSGLC